MTRTNLPALAESGISAFEFEVHTTANHLIPPFVNLNSATDPTII